MVYIFVPCSRITGGADSNRALRGRMLGLSYALCLWSENAIVFSHWSGQELAGQILYLLK
jgi:hypothetical protein